jgi:NAD(P)-dependent dehydrogenase (short-subunit alcohol dehydrogenase family)
MLTGRFALITGGSRGLGREIAQTFVRAGASVAVVARPSSTFDTAVASLEAARVSPEQRIEAICADLARHDRSQDVIEDARRRLGAIDVLVNNAGILGPIGAVGIADHEAWMATIDINLLAPVALIRAVIPEMRQRGRGKIINLSGGGATSPRANFTAYASAKAGLVRFTETVAEEVRDAGIDVNAVAPGAMNTRMLDEVLAAGPELAGEPEYRRAVAQKASGGSPPARAAGLVLWLASSASDGVTGRVLSALWDPWEGLAARRAELAESDIYTLRRIVPADRGQHWDERD